MRQDELLNTANRSPLDVPRLRTGPHANAWIWPAALAVLVATTTLAVAIFGSSWFVPVYLVLVALILGIPGDKRDPAFASSDVRKQATEQGSQSVAVEGEESKSATDPLASSPLIPLASASRETDASGFATASGLGTETASAMGKSVKKGRSRTRKPRATVAAQATPEPLEEQLPGTLATWVRVGPGKFVRADAAPSFLDVELAPTPSDPSLTTEPEPAAAPGAGIVGSETEGKGEDLGITESQEALNLAEGHAPEAAVETSPEDNGNAPDASEELALSRRESVIEPPDRGFEPILDVAIEPETVAVTEPSPDAPPRPSVSCPEASTSADENVSADLGCPAEVDREPLPLSAAATVNQDRPRARSSIWSSASFWRALSRSRMPAQATTAKGSRPLPGNVRSIYPDSRVRTGPDRSPRRGREIGRSHPTERDHPPRSPPTRAGFRKGVGDLQHRPSTKSEGAAPFERPDAALRRLTIVRMKGHFSRLIVNAPQAPQSPQLSPPL